MQTLKYAKSSKPFKVHHEVQLWSHEDTRVKSLYRYLWQVYFSGCINRLVSTIVGLVTGYLSYQAPELLESRTDGSMIAKENFIVETHARRQKRGQRSMYPIMVAVFIWQ